MQDYAVIILFFIPSDVSDILFVKLGTEFQKLKLKFQFDRLEKQFALCSCTHGGCKSPVLTDTEIKSALEYKTQTTK